MDTVKTGALIASRRSKLNLTQKELAQTLHISDRTVSKWERGAGFPDISLMEPLADALGITVVELLHGQEEPHEISPEAERSAREIIRGLGPELAQKLKRAQRVLSFLRILLIIAAAAALLLSLHPVRYEVFSGTQLSPAQALKLCPFSLITADEYRFISRLASDEEIIRLFSDDANHPLDEHIPYLEEILSIDGVQPDTIDLTVIGHSICLTYTLDNRQCILSCGKNAEQIVKVSAEFGRLVNSNIRYCIQNIDNTDFLKIDGKRDLLGPLRDWIGELRK